MPASSAGRTENTGHEAFGDQLPSHEDRDQQTSGTVPVAFVLVSDPVAQGFADSLTKSGGNLTGFSRYELSIGCSTITYLALAC